MTSTTDTIVEGIYEAALDDSRWVDCLANLGNLTGSPVSTGIWIEDAVTGEVPLLETTAPPELLQPYEDHYAATFPERFWRAEEPIGRVTRLEDFWPDESYQQSEYLNDYALPYDVPISIISMVDRNSRYILRTCQCRRLREGAFTATMTREVTRYLPHFARAFAIRDELTVLREETTAKAQALDRLPLGVLFLDDRGQVREVNRTARTIAGASDGFAIGREGRLRAATPALTAELEALVAQTCASDGEPVDAGGAMELPRPSGLRPYNALVCPLRSLGFDIGLGRWRAVLFLRDSETEQVPPIELIQRLHGLSRREAEAVWALSHGKRHREIADELAVSVDTLRTYLRRAADKTGVRRQGELVRLIIGNPLLFDDQ